MYYLLYGLLYSFSLLPFRVMYVLSDGIAWFVFNVLKYRRTVVLNNLKIAFPEMNDAQRKTIALKMYHNFIDTFLESIKMLSLSDKELEKRVILDQTALNDVAARGKNIQIHSGHQFNWEYGNVVYARDLTPHFVGVYMPIHNKAIDRLFLKLRSRFKTVLVPAPEFSQQFKMFSQNRYTLALLADQNAHPQKAYWLNFFGKPAPFPTGPDKGARANGTAVFFIKSVKKSKRGFYAYVAEKITEDASNFQDGELTRMFRDYMEKVIREQPENYLWTHKRWRRQYNKGYERRWIDTAPPPNNTNHQDSAT